MLEDGTELPADLVVYATGYGSMNGWAADLISQEVADKVGKVWGLGSDTTKDPGPWEGEQRNMWKPTQQEALWFHGGNLHQSRHYSLYLALQLKARAEGIETPVYGLQEVHHLVMIANDFYTPEVQGAYQLHGIGDFELEEGGTIPDLQLAVATYGTLNEAKDNAILIPTWFSGTHQTWELVYIGPGRALDPDRWFIVVVNQIGNGLSTSPHNTDGAVAMSRVPARHASVTTCAPRSSCCGRCSASSGSPWWSAARWAPSRPTSGRCASPTRCCGPRRSPAPRGTRRTTSCSPSR